MARDSVEGYMAGLRILPENVAARLFSTDFRRQLQGYRSIEVLQSHLGAVPCDDPVTAVQYLDVKTYLPGDILTKVDRASMAHSLEVRVPFLDHEFVEWAFRLPSAVKLRGTEGKYLLKKAMETYLGNELLYRRKMGFAVPLAKWLRGPLKQRIEQTVVSDRVSELGVFERDTLVKILNDHMRGRFDHSAFLWALLMFDASCSRLAVS
jgi:asparagine synthase (glutamine-hydrolysing)